MIDAFIRGSLGDLGTLILDFYINNAYLINGILLVYALLVVWARQGYQQIAKRLQDYFTANYGENASKKDVSWFKKTLERSPLDWREVAGFTKIPLISPIGSIGLHIKSEKSVSKLFTPEKIKACFES